MLPAALLRIAREALDASGYEVAFRRQGWVDCLIWTGDERWVGRGGTDEEALSDALRQMLPSRLSRKLLEAHREGAPDTSVGADGEDVEDGGAERGGDETDPELFAAHALAGTQQLERDIDEYEPIVAGLPPDRQRLWLLIWICRARAYQEGQPAAPELQETAQRVARRLADIAKAFWPGPVRALQPSATPRDIGLGRRQGENPAGTWEAAVGLAEEALEEHLAVGEAAGLDEDGWADAALLSPPPRNGDALLEQISAEIESLSAAPGAPSSVAGLDELSVDRITHLARNLRWLRGAAEDRVRWGTAMGRLRQIAYALGSRGDRVDGVCDPRYVPARPWAWEVMEAAPRAPEDAPASVGPLPPSDAGSEALAGWVLRALDALEMPQLVELLAPRREEIYSLEDTLPTRDRRLKRCFRDLVRFLVAKDAAPESTP